MSDETWDKVDTNARLLTMLADKLAGEPEEPDPERHTGHGYNIVARTYDEWQSQVSALRLLLGVRMVNAALDELEKRT